MPSRALSLVAWGTPQDIAAGSGWASSGALTVTGGKTDPFGGTNATELNDTSGAAAQGRLWTTGVSPTRAQHNLIICIKNVSGTLSSVFFHDTLGGDTIVLSVTWSGSVPTVVAQAGSGGTAVVTAVVALGNGWYAVEANHSNWTPGHAVQVQLYPAYQGSVATTGAVQFFMQNMVLLDLLGAPKSFSRPAMGYEAVTAPSSIRDAWKVKAPDEVLRGRASWIPTIARSFPQSVSGWDGVNEATGINTGVKAMLEAGWDMNVLRVATDRSQCTTYNDCYLTQPTEDWEPELEGNADRAVQVELVSQTPFTGF